MKTLAAVVFEKLLVYSDRTGGATVGNGTFVLNCVEERIELVIELESVKPAAGVSLSGRARTGSQRATIPCRPQLLIVSPNVQAIPSQLGRTSVATTGCCVLFCGSRASNSWHR